MSNDKTKSTLGSSLLFVLTVIFICLKIEHVIDWSWWVVFLPIWSPFVLAAFVFLWVLLFIGAASIITSIISWITRK